MKFEMPKSTSNRIQFFPTFGPRSDFFPSFERRVEFFESTFGGRVEAATLKCSSIFDPEDDLVSKTNKNLNNNFSNIIRLTSVRS